MKVIIMAGGAGDRWGADSSARQRATISTLPEYKQLINIGGENIVERMVRMLREREIEDITVIAPLYFHGFIGDAELEVIPREIPGPLLEGIAHSEYLWGFDRTLFLLGDVVISPAMMNTVIDNRDGCRFIGRLGENPVTGKEAPELFGLTVGRWKYMEVYAHCRWMCQRGRDINYPAKLWALYRLMCGLKHDDYDVDNKLLLEVEDDYTDDIDSVQEYQNYGSKLVIAALEADRAAPAGSGCVL